FQWAKKHNGAANREDRAIAVETDTSGNSYVTGYSYLAAGCEFFTIKYNSTGDSAASANYHCINTSTLNQPKAITSDNAGNIYVTGFGQCDVNNNFDYLTIKYNSSLTAQWTGPSLYIGSGNCQSNAITYTNAHIYVTGEADSSGKRKFLTVKYDANNGAELLRWSYQTSDSNYATSVGTD